MRPYEKKKIMNFKFKYLLINPLMHEIKYLRLFKSNVFLENSFEFFFLKNS